MADDKKQPAKHAFKLDVLYFIAVVFAVLLIRDFLVGETHGGAARRSGRREPHIR